MARIDAISVIMPTYNAMPYLQAAVESILGQTFDRIELVIVNDGSTDQSGEYLRSLTDPRVRVINQDNRGAAAAYDAGLRAARYDWVAPMDADDVALPQRLEREAAFLEQNPHYDLVSCSWGYIGKNGRRLKAVHVPELRSPPRFQPLIDSVIVDGGMLYCKEAVLQVGGYANDCVTDLTLALRLDEAGYRLASIPDVLLLVRVLPGSVSSRNYYRQLVSARYVRACSVARRRGEREPHWEEFAKENWPRGWRRLRAEGARQFRFAGIAWAAGDYVQAALRLLLSFVLRPMYVVSKFRMYFFSDAGTQVAPLPRARREDAP